MIAPARIAAYDILLAVSTGRLDLQSAVERARPALADDRDRALANDIAMGVQRRRATLDHLIEHFSKRPIDRLDPEIVEVLRLSLYQLLHLTRVPAAAVVNDAVDLAGKAGKKSAGGLVNAVLRAVSRKRTALPLPPRPTDLSDRRAALDYLSVTLSHPRWLAERWYQRLGLDTSEQWMAFNNTPARVTLRANRLMVTRDELQARLADREILTTPGRYAPDALIVEAGNPLREPGPGAGLFVVQDEASQLVSLLAGATPGPLLLDTCASPGGKTTALAAAAGAQGRVIACDVRDGRIDVLRRTVEQVRAGNVRIVQADLLAPLPFCASFDCVLVDVPCSGLGTLRRDPDIRWRRQEADLAPLAADQLRMLCHAADGVRPGARLVYATCSSEPEENEQVVDRFLRRSPAFAAVDARTVHPQLSATLVDDRGHLRTSPDGHGLEAFFGAVFIRLGNNPTTQRS